MAVGFCNVQKALLCAMLQPDGLKEMQDKNNFTKLMVIQEELKTLPFSEVRNEYCRQCKAPAMAIGSAKWKNMKEKF